MEASNKMSSIPDEITNSQDVIDIRDVIERIEYLEAEESLDNIDKEELKSLKKLMKNCEGMGGDEEYKGIWYPLLLIREDYFEDYAQQEAEDLGLIKTDLSWPYNCIDWEEAAEQLKLDYTDIDFKGVTYYAR
jgi:hypothetical protein